jgi:MYXO-CTERM domain-containing protein
LGLLHPCEDDCTPSDEGSALHPVYRPSQVMLGSDDIEGVCFLYPSECEGPACDLTCRQVDSADASDECPWLGDPCVGETGSLCAYGHCASDGYCSLSCGTDRDCSGRQSCSEGLCVPERVGRYGESCERGNGCLSLLCVTVGNDSMCTRGCDGIPCPGTDTCSVVDDQAVYTPLAPATGCSLGRSPTSPPAFALVGVFFFAWMRRKRPSSASPTRPSR